jgi:RimJ/RimL family protein N-acetyltransferase
LECAENEYQRGVAVSFAVRYEGRFIGEAILYSFDLHGGAQSAVRIIPEYRRKGLATGALALLSKIASRMGLIRMLATVDSENEASCRMCESFFDGFSKEGKNNLYTKNL